MEATGEISEAEPISNSRGDNDVAEILSGYTFTWRPVQTVKIGHLSRSPFARRLVASVLAFLILLPLIFILLRPGTTDAAWYSDTWKFRKLLTINSSKVPSTQTNFPVMVSITDQSLKTHAQGTGNDILFTDSTGSTKLSHEIEQFATGSGKLIAWVKIPSLSSSVDTKIYMYYGNPSATTQQDAANVWDTSYKGVWHMKRDPAGTAPQATDSTANANSGTSGGSMTSADLVTGKVDKAWNFDNADDYANAGSGSSLDNIRSLTVSAWVNTVSVQVNFNVIVDKRYSAGGWHWGFLGTNTMQFKYGRDVQEGWWTTDNNTITTTGAWQYLTVTYDSSSTTNDPVMYINGASVTANETLTPSGNVLDDSGNEHWIGNRGTLDRGFDGDLDEIRVSATIRSADWITTEYNNQSDPTTFLSMGQPEQKGAPVLYWKFDEGYGTQAFDTSANNNPGTISGSAWQDQAALCLFDSKCLKFDGTDDKVSRTYTADTELDPGTASFSVSSWFKHPNSISATETLIARSNNAVNGIGYKVYMKSTGVLCFGIDDDATTFPDDETCSTPTYKDSYWHHVEAVKTGTSSITLYVDGKQVNQKAGLTATGSLSGTSPPFYVGIDGNGSASPWNGFIDEIKVFDYAKSADQVKADYTAKGSVLGSSAVFGPGDADSSLNQGLIAYWKMDDGVGNACSAGVDKGCDSSGNGNTGTWTNGAASTSGKFGFATNYDGVNDMFDPPSTTVATTHTISLWVYPIPSSDSYGALTVQSDSNSGVFYRGSTRKIDYFYNSTDHHNNTALTENTWSHILISVTAGTATFYVNGVADGTATGVPSYNIDQIGNDGNSEGYKGKLDDLRIYNRTLTDSEVSRLYDWGPGPVGHWKFDERSGTTANDSSGNANTGTITAGTDSWIAGKMGSAYKFNATTTVVNAGSASSLDNVPASGMTLEGWVYPKSAGENSLGYIMAKNVGTSPSSGWVFRLNSATSLTFTVDGSTDLVRTTNTSVLTQNAWNHVAVSWDGDITTASSVHIYVNSTEVGYATTTNGASRVDDASSTFFIGNDSTSARTFDGLIDDARIYNYVKTNKQIVSDMNADHPAVGSPVGSAIGHWKFDEGYGTVANNSGSAGSISNGTLTGMASPATYGSGWTNHGKFGKALNFDNSNDFVSVTANSSLNTASFSAGGWFKPSTTQGQGLITKNDGGNSWRLFMNGGGQIEFDAKNDTINLLSATNLTAEQWTHVYATYESSTNEMRIYINGKRDARQTASGDLGGTNNSDLVIGIISTPSSFPFDGVIDDVKYYNYALSDDEIKTEYNQGKAIVLGSLATESDGITASNSAARAYCPPGDTATCNAPVAHWTLDERSGTSAFDITGNANTGTLTNGPVWTTGKVGQAIKFDGVNDEVSIPDPASGILDFPAGSSITLSMWVKPHPGNMDVANGTRLLFAKVDDGGQSGMNYAFWTHDDQSNPRGVTFMYQDGSELEGYAVSDSVLPPNKWTYLAVTYTFGTGSSMKIYADGILRTGSWIFGSSGGNDSPVTNNEDLEMGFYNATNSFIGTMDDVRVYNYARTPAQIAWEYNQGKPLAHYKLDECTGTTANDSSGKGNNGAITIDGTGSQTSAGNCTTVDTLTAWYNGRNGKYNSSLNFDGTDDYVNLLSSGLATYTYDNLTFSAWYKSADTTSTDDQYFYYHTDGSEWVLLGATDDGGETDQLRFKTAIGGVERTYYGNIDVVDQQWHHIVFVRDNTNVKTYVDGVPDIDTADLDPAESITVNGASILAIGDDPSVGTEATKGSLDDLRLYNYALTQAQVRTVYNENSAVRFGPITGSP